MIWILYAVFSAEPRQHKRMIDILNKVCSDVRTRYPNVPFRYDEIAGKKDVVECVKEIRAQGSLVDEWHFVGFGTPYGPLFGSPDQPEEISTFEWAGLNIPFTTQAKAWFYMAGSDRWFAPYMASLYKITAYGFGSRLKSDLSDARAYRPEFWPEGADYNPIAALYAEAFKDITVRRDECRWLLDRLTALKPQRLLDIGCGNGALLAYLSDKISEGVGADISAEAIKIAVSETAHIKNLSFTVIEGPRLPFDDQSFDAVVSLLSFRYLDWDPVVAEMRRVLAPGGHILIVDMLASSPRLHEWPKVMTDKLKNLWYLRNRSGYKKNLRALVTHPAWRKMVARHPLRGQNEFAWYLKSRFPGGRLQVLNTGVKAKILSFDSGPVG